MNPLTILYIGNFTRPWCTEVHVAGSLELQGHKVHPLQENDQGRHSWTWEMLPRIAEEVGAHLLLWTRTWSTPMQPAVEALNRLRDLGIPSASYHLDRWLGLNREHQVQDEPFFQTDLVVTPHDSPRWKELGVPHLWMPPGVYRPECQPAGANRRAFPWNVVFLGSHPYPHPEWQPIRARLIEAFQRAFGQHFAVLPAERRGRPIRGHELRQLYSSVPVLLGDSCLAGSPEGYWSDRVPETLGRGGYLIHPEVPGYIGPDGSWYRHLEHLATFPVGDTDRAVELAQAALEEPERRRRVAAAGQAQVLERDTYDLRLAHVLSYIQDRHGFRDTRPATVVPKISDSQPRRRARLGRWSARFEPRPIDVTDGNFVVVTEVWEQNDYRVPLQGLSGTVLDVGANVGAFTVLAAMAGADKVVACEPEPGNRERLYRHVALNLDRAGQRRIVVEDRAITGAKQGPVLLSGAGGDAYTSTLYTTKDDPEPRSVQTVTLRRLLEEHGPVELLKMDVEGAEYDILAGVSEAELGQVRRIALEFHGPEMPGGERFDASHLERWKAMVAKLANVGRVEIIGHPRRAGLLYWTRY